MLHGTNVKLPVYGVRSTVVFLLNVGIILGRTLELEENNSASLGHLSNRRAQGIPGGNLRRDGYGAVSSFGMSHRYILKPFSCSRQAYIPVRLDEI